VANPPVAIPTSACRSYPVLTPLSFLNALLPVRFLVCMPAQPLTSSPLPATASARVQLEGWGGGSGQRRAAVQRPERRPTVHPPCPGGCCRLHYPPHNALGWRGWLLLVTVLPLSVKAMPLLPPPPPLSADVVRLVDVFCSRRDGVVLPM
jgi:hypothetical protein